MALRVMDKYEVRAIDTLNLQVFELRDAKKKDGTVSSEWVPRTYHGSVESAVRWIANHAAKEDLRVSDYDLGEFLRQMDKYTRAIEKTASRLSETR